MKFLNLFSLAFFAFQVFLSISEDNWMAVGGWFFAFLNYLFIIVLEKKFNSITGRSIYEQ